MIQHRCFPTEPWAVRETELDLSVLAQSESIFALSNGHIGLRANLEEGEPHGLPGTYLNSFYETRPLPYAEAGYGYPEVGQTLVNVTNGKIIRLLVDDEPFDVRYGQLRAHERVLDLRAGRAATRGRVGLAGGPGGPGLLGAPRLVRAARGRGDPVRGRAARSAGAAGRAVRAGGQRAAAGRRPGRSPGRRRRSARRCAPSTSAAAATPGSCSCTRTKRAACGWRRRWTTSSTGRRAHETSAESSEDLGRRDGRHRARAGAAAAAGEVPRLRLVEPALAAGGARPGRGGARRRASQRLGGAR